MCKKHKKNQERAQIQIKVPTTTNSPQDSFRYAPQPSETSYFYTCCRPYLALGIESTTVFSLANSVFLRQLPVRDPHNLVWVFSNNEAPSSYPDYVEYRNETEIFDGLLAYDWVPLNLGANGQAERVQGALVSGNYFDVLGIKAQMGRTISPGDDETQVGAPVAVISDGLWQRQFNKDSNVIGKSLVLNGHTFTVIGVLQTASSELGRFSRDLASVIDGIGG